MRSATPVQLVPRVVAAPFYVQKMVILNQIFWGIFFWNLVSLISCLLFVCCMQVFGGRPMFLLCSHPAFIHMLARVPEEQNPQMPNLKLIEMNLAPRGTRVFFAMPVVHRGEG